MSVYNWSQVSANNATSDPSINYQEGQAPSTLNDSARAMMSGLAKWRDDLAGLLITTGTATAYAVSSNSGFDTLAHLHGQVIAFSPNITNTQGSPSVTLNVDGLGAKPLRSAPFTDLAPGVLIQGTPYCAVYNNTDGAFYLQGFYGSPSFIPLGAGMDFWAPTAPNSSFVFPFGQAISRTVYAAYFALVGTTFGSGDGSTTFNLPDKRGRVSAGGDAMGGTPANRITTFSMAGGALGNIGGSESHVLTTAEMPVHNHGVTDTHFHSVSAFGAGGSSGSSTSFLQSAAAGGGALNTTLATGGSISINNAGSGNAHAIVQPTIVCNYIMRII